MEKTARRIRLLNPAAESGHIISSRFQNPGFGAEQPVPVIRGPGGVDPQRIPVGRELHKKPVQGKRRGSAKAFLKDRRISRRRKYKGRRNRQRGQQDSEHLIPSLK